MPFVEPGHDMDMLLERFANGSDDDDHFVAKIRDLRDRQWKNAAKVQQPSSRGLSEPLTRREEQILTLLADRLQNKEIAGKLFVSTETVKTHLKNVYEKLGVHGRAQAAVSASEMNLF